MIPSAPVDICNLALDIMGEAPIASIDDPETEKEELMARWYDTTRRAVLRKYLWNFAQKWRVLARTGAGEGEYADAYALPNDFVRLNGVGEHKDRPYEEFELGEGVLYASKGNSISIRYNRDVTNVAKFDPLFVNLFALRLARATAFQITKKKTMVEIIDQLLKQAEPESASVDGQERKPIRIQNSKYLAARRHGSSSSGKYYDC